MTTETESQAEQTIFVVEQFQGTGYREVAAVITRERARDAMSRMRYRLPGVPCRIVEKPARESEIWNRVARIF